MSHQPSVSETWARLCGPIILANEAWNIVRTLNVLPCGRPRDQLASWAFALLVYAYHETRAIRCKNCTNEREIPY